MRAWSASAVAQQEQFLARLAAVMRSNGVKAVSGSETRTRSTGRLISLAAICASAVFNPWPISTELVSTFKLPSALSLTVEVEVVGVAMHFRHRLTRGERIALLQNVFEPDLQRINPEGVSDNIHLRFMRPGYLGDTVTAKGC